MGRALTGRLRPSRRAPQLETETEIIPFFDEPVFNVLGELDRAVGGTVTCAVVLLGFIRNG
jgi:hypothetical protein